MFSGDMVIGMAGADVYFDASQYGEARSCLEALSALGLVMGPRLGARLWGLARRGVRFSLAFLDEAANEPGSPAAQCLKDASWNQAGMDNPQSVGSLAERYGAAICREDGFIGVLTQDELPASDSAYAQDVPLQAEVRQVPNSVSAVSEDALVAPSSVNNASPLGSVSVLPAVAPGSGSLLPSVLGVGDASTFESKGALWDRTRMEEAALSLLDNEDDDELIASFRYLFRAGLACGQSPAGLMASALKRGKSRLSAEVAKLVGENLNRELGRALGDILSGDSARIKDGIHCLACDNAVGNEYRPLLRAVLLPALTPLLKVPDSKKQLMSGLTGIIPILCDSPSKNAPQNDVNTSKNIRINEAMYRPYAQAEGDCSPVLVEAGDLEEFLDALLADLEELDLGPRLAISAFLVDLAPHYAGCSAFLLRRMRSTLQPNAMAFFGNMLARMSLTEEQRSEVIGRLTVLWKERAQEAGMARRLRATFRSLGTQALYGLSREALAGSMGCEQRVALVHLWHDFRLLGLELQDSLLAELALREFVRGGEESLGVFLALLRTEQLDTPAFLRAWQDLDRRDPRASAQVGVYLAEQAERFEEPDCGAILTLMAQRGSSLLVTSFDRVREEAALEGGGDAVRVLIFAKLARRLRLSEVDLKQLRAMVSELLQFPYLDKTKLPLVWEAVGQLCAVEGLGGKVQEAMARCLISSWETFPKEKIGALRLLYPVSSHQVRLYIESSMRSVLHNSEPPRKVLSQILQALLAWAGGSVPLSDSEGLVMDLCRTVLSKSQEPSLQNLMAMALRENTASLEEFDGVRIPFAWGREDRHLALRILGALACNPLTPERLQRSLVFRLFAFMTDWFEGLESGKNLYEYRDTPLWSVLDGVLAQRPGPDGVELGRQLCLRTLEGYHRALPGLDLENRESALVFLLNCLRREKEERPTLNGVSLDLRAMILRAVIKVSAQDAAENGIAARLLHELSHEQVLPEALSLELEAVVGH